MLFNSRYRVEEKLGQGGAGIVYRAFDTTLQRPVAIKSLEPSPAGPDQGVERLRREAALLSRLAHPNIVSFYDWGEADGRPYLVMEYIAGCTLRALLAAHQAPLPLELALHIINNVLAALSAAHGAAVIHRDLKPENIMLVGVQPDMAFDLAPLQPEVKVMDFGLAYLTGEVHITAENLVAGTALYLAPEAALGQTVDERADLYAVGLILYELVAGRLPFLGSDPLVVISQHLHAAPLSPRWYNANLPPTLATIILKLLAKTPSDRYASAAAVLADLETIEPFEGDDRSLTKTSLLEAITRGRLVGREAEIGLLRNAIDQMLHGTVGVIFIEGEAGIGKTCLVHEASLYAYLKGVEVFTGHCYDADLILPYQPFIEIVKGYVLAQIKPGSTGYLSANLAAELVRLAPGLELHLGVAPASTQISPAEARLRLFEAVTTLLTGGSKPSLIILENMHWASPADLALLAHLARTETRHRRLLLIVTYQGSQQQQGSVQTLTKLINQLTRTRLATHLRLSPLQAEEVTALLETFLEGEIAPDFSQAILAVTEGNPFFIEETLKALLEEGRIVYDRAHDRWEGVNLQQLAIPASLKEVMDRRFEKLSQAHRDLLTLAALLGRRFRVDVLLAAAATREETVLEAMEEASRMQLISRVPLAEAGRDVEIYTFDHSLIRQALSETLRPPQRQRLHRQIGTALEKLNQSRSQPVALPDELAYHFSQAGEDETQKAISYSLVAIDNALRVYASEVAVKHYQLILDLLEHDPDVGRRAWILEQLGDLYLQQTRQLVDAVAAYEWAIQLWQTTPDPDLSALIRLYRHIGEITRYWPGPLERLDSYLAEALRLLDQDTNQAESLERARVLAAMAFNLHNRRDSSSALEEALHLAQIASELAARLNAANEESTALDAMQRIYRSQGNLAAAHETDRRRLALIPHMTNPTEVVEANLGASQMGWETGDLATATNFCLEALAIAKRTDNIGGQWEALRRLVMLHLQWGKLSAATSYATQGVALGPRAGLLEFGEPVEALFHTHLAILHTLQGKAEAAARELAELSGLYPTSEAPPYRSALGWLHYEVEAWTEARLNLESGQAFPSAFLPSQFGQILLVEVYGHQGDEAALNQVGPIAEAEAHHGNVPYLLAILERGYGAFYTTQGLWTEAEAAFKRALAATRRKTLWYQDARTWLDYGRMLAQRNQPGDTDLALDFFSEAQSLFTTFGAHTLAEKAWIEATRLSQN